MLRHTLLLLACSAAPVLGQGAPGSPGAPASPPRSTAEFARDAWREVRSNLLRAAQAAPDSVFAYRPGPGVRTFGETLDHVAASQHGYCRMALGERPTGGGAGTGATTKAEIVAALESSNAICESAHAQGEADLALPAYGDERSSRLQVLLANAMHDGEHYGNIVTYLRLHGIVPPSSQPPSRE